MMSSTEDGTVVAVTPHRLEGSRSMRAAEGKRLLTDELGAKADNRREQDHCPLSGDKECNPERRWEVVLKDIRA
jgi:hypothetical protein